MNICGKLQTKQMQFDIATKLAPYAIQPGFTTKFCVYMVRCITIITGAKANWY